MLSHGSGPPVVVLHEITGASTEFFAFTEHLLAAGFTVHCPVLFGPVDEPYRPLQFPKRYLQSCVRGLFACNAAEADRPVYRSVNELCADVSGGTRRVGIIGMCLTGAFPIAAMRCRHVAAPVLCQPALPTAGSADKDAALSVPLADIDYARHRLRTEQLKALVVHYEGDPRCPAARIQALRDQLGGQVDMVTLPGSEHSTLVYDPSPTARARVVQFLCAQL